MGENWNQPTLQLAIIGAGIAGLTAAIGLKGHPGIDVQIYERATELKEIGASIALGPNGMRTLDRFGISNALDDSIAFRNKSGHYKTNAVVSVDKHKGDVERRHLTARFHRPHLQEALLKHVNQEKIHLGKAFGSVDFDEISQKLVVKFSDSTSTTADVLLGADGIHSAVRRFFVPESATRWTGWVAFRSVFPISLLSHIPDLPDEANHFWGPNRMLFISPLGRGLFTVVGSYQSNPNDPNALFKDSVWNTEGDLTVLRSYYRDWSPLVRAIVDAIPYTRVYPNASASGLESWIHGNGRVAFAGDAAHAHGGALAAGGSLAIDDAWAFAASILHVFPESSTPIPSGPDILKALQLYERTRKPHTDRMLDTVKQMNIRTLDRLGQAETDEQLRARMKSRGDPSWIHEHDVTAAFTRSVREDSGGVL